MRKEKQKKILISSVAGVLALAIAGGSIWLGVTRAHKDPIKVIRFMDVGMTEYWGDSQESHGPVSSDNIQTVFLTDTQQVTEVLVKEGDTVKKGDPMMTFDTTLSGLDLERKRLEVEKLKLELIDQEEELKKIKGMRPMQLPPVLPEVAPDLGTALTVPYRISGKLGFDGSSLEAPLICWLQEGTVVDSQMVADILQYALDLRVDSAVPRLSAPSAAEPEETESQPPEETEETKATAETEIIWPSETDSAETDPTESEPAETEAPKPAVVQPPSKENWELGVVKADKLTFYSAPSPDAEVIAEKSCHQAAVKVFEQVRVQEVNWGFIALGTGETVMEGWVQMDGNIEIQKKPETIPADPPVPVDPEPSAKKVVVDFYCTPSDARVSLRRNSGETVFPTGKNIFEVEPGNYYYSVEYENYKSVYEKKLAVSGESDKIEIHVELEKNPDTSGLNSVYVIFKVTEDNMSKGSRIVWQGFKLYQNGSFLPFDAGAIPDFTMTADLEEESAPSFDFGSGLTAAQIAELRVEQEKKIQETRLKVKMAEADYKIKKRELEDGNIYAEFDGKVVSLLSEEDARQQKKPMIKVSGGGGFHVIGNVNELDREKMKIGQEVTVNDWNSGETYPGKVIAIGDFPIRGRGYSGRGNPNSSYYPFTVFVDGEANLQTGSYVNIQYSSGGENGIYLSNPFVRTEKGESYVYVLGENNRLEKRTVTTGKALWGSYTEIRSGLSEEDYLAFPYGKNVKPGAKAEIGDMSDFWS